MSAVPISEFKAHCLEVIRQVEQSGAGVDILRHGKVVAHLLPAAGARGEASPWLRLSGLGNLQAAPEESVLDGGDFTANRP